jgi:hypothetical protein
MFVKKKKRKKKERKRYSYFSAARFVISEESMTRNYPDIITYNFL